MQTDFLLLTDSALHTALQSTARQPRLKACPPRARSDGLSGEPESGEEIYRLWRGFADIAKGKAEECTQRFEECSQQVFSLEGQKNACYTEKDGLQIERDTTKAQEAELAEERQYLMGSIDEARAIELRMEAQLKIWQKEKDICKVVRWLPPYGISKVEIIKAINQTEKNLSDNRRKLDDMERYLGELLDQYQACQEKLASFSVKICEIYEKIRRLEGELGAYQAQRDQAAWEMIAWKDRERYYLSIAGEMEHLINMEADAEEFQKLIADNPPQFELVLE